jgi:hypothetical protein
MNWQNSKFKLHTSVSYILLVFLLASCAQSPKSCPSQRPADLSGAIAFASNDQLPFRFPLDELGHDVRPFPAIFCTSGDTGSGREYHAAEDYHLPAGTPVYAMADGEISFSGPMGGYGWLIIIDHPQANFYSLYGHLSPSRWRAQLGIVEKGDLIAYLGDSDENGGSSKQPLRPHLHFGLRAGQRSDYSGMGEWRWQAGWIKPCPQDLGWLRPSLIISSQDIPTGGFPEPTAAFLAKWGVELLLTGFYLLWGVGMLVIAIRKDKPFVVVLIGLSFIVVGWIFHSKGAKMSYALFAVAIAFSAAGIYKFVRHSIRGSHLQS